MRLSICLSFLIPLFSFSQYLWETLPVFPGPGRYAATGFSMNGKGYVVTGYQTSGPILFRDTWEYNPLTATWTQKAMFGGTARWYASSFVIGNKAYLGMGVSTADFWEYDPALDQWIQKNNFPGPARSEGIAFSVGGKGYVGLGSPPGSSNYMKDFWEYDPLNDTWAQLADFPGGPRGFAVSFVVGQKAYVTAGESSIFPSTYHNDLWEFDAVSKIWTAKQSLPLARTTPVAFSLNGYGYVGMGRAMATQLFYPQDNWRYNPNADQWTSAPAMPVASWGLPVTFAVGDTAYVVTGWPGENNFWKFYFKLPPLSVGVNSKGRQVLVHPNPSDGRIIINGTASGEILITLANTLGAKVYEQKFDGETDKISHSIDLSTFEKGIYFLQLKDSYGLRFQKIVIQ